MLGIPATIRRYPFNVRASSHGIDIAFRTNVTFLVGENGSGKSTLLEALAECGPGRIAWFDISTTSLPRSKESYGKLFDWQFAPVQGSDQAVAGHPVGLHSRTPLSPAPSSAK